MVFARCLVLASAVLAGGVGFSQPVSASSLSMQVLSATVKSASIPGATVIIQKNGHPSQQATSDAQGGIRLTTPFDDDNDTFLIIRKNGYSDLVVKCPCDGLSYALSPVLTELDSLRVVLSWGKDPKDLDAHMVFPGNNIYFEKMKGKDALLDVDDIDSYGPETITLLRKHHGETYVYAVHDFTNRNNPQDESLSASHARVFVYVGQSLVRTYFVPESQKGNLWTVFRITGEGDFQDINTLQGVRVQAENVLDHVTPYATATKVVAENQARRDPARADALNKGGESAYHAGKLDTAINLFLQAIESNPEHGQAYSNLGLTYQKAGREAEGIWANRKAIALANGPNAAGVRANSYYNIGRVYEAKSQFQDALEQYELARRERQRPAYDEAIARVRARL